jgi:hypothetical protein
MLMSYEQIIFQVAEMQYQIPQYSEKDTKLSATRSACQQLPCPSGAARGGWGIKNTDYVNESASCAGRAALHKN